MLTSKTKATADIGSVSNTWEWLPAIRLLGLGMTGIGS